jgi:hypothetical protein
MLGSNSADTAGNRIKATTKEQLFSRFGQWSAQAKAAYDPDGSKDVATLAAEANNDFGQAEPARFSARAFAANGSPAYLYRFSYIQAGMREFLKAGAPHGGEISFVFGTLGVGGFGRQSRPRLKIWRSLVSHKAIGSTSPRPGIPMVRACQIGRASIQIRIRFSISIPMARQEPSRILGRRDST